MSKVAPPNGQAIVTIKIYTNRGCPVLWTKPDIVMVEPKASSVIAALGT